MKKFLNLFKAGIFLLLGASAAFANAEGTPEEAKALALKAAAHYAAVGKENALKDFMTQESNQFKDRDLYVFCINDKGTVLANGGSPKIVGKNFYNLKDLKGVFFQREIIKVAKEQKEGWADYHWKHPITNKIAPKTSYSIMVEPEVICGVGAYK